MVQLWLAFDTSSESGHAVSCSTQLKTPVLLQREESLVTVFMGVPTMYSHLLSFYDDMAPGEQSAARAAAQRLRLTVSGSAACPLPIMKRWHALSGALPTFVSHRHIFMSCQVQQTCAGHPLILCSRDLCSLITIGSA